MTRGIEEEQEEDDDDGDDVVIGGGGQRFAGNQVARTCLCLFG